MANKTAIRAWMHKNVASYVDECNEVNATLLVEDWDTMCGKGWETLDPDHIAWEIGAEVATEYEKKVRDV